MSFLDKRSRKNNSYQGPFLELGIDLLTGIFGSGSRSNAMGEDTRLSTSNPEQEMDGSLVALGGAKASEEQGDKFEDAPEYPHEGGGGPLSTETLPSTSALASYHDINPEDKRLYLLALNNRWPRRQLFHLVASETPFFFYDSLVLPWVLARVLNTSSSSQATGQSDGYGRTAISTEVIEGTARRVTPATLRDHLCYTMTIDGSPVVISTKKEDGTVLPQDQQSNKQQGRSAAVEGMLVAGLSSQETRTLEEYCEARSTEKRVEEVQVVTSENEVVVVAAHVYVWNGPEGLLEPKRWDLVEYMRSR